MDTPKKPETFRLGDVELAMLENPEVKREWLKQRVRYEEVAKVLNEKFREFEMFGDSDDAITKKYNYLQDVAVELLNAIAAADTQEFRM